MITVVLFKFDQQVAFPYNLNLNLKMYFKVTKF